MEVQVLPMARLGASRRKEERRCGNRRGEGNGVSFVAFPGRRHPDVLL